MVVPSLARAPRRRIAPKNHQAGWSYRRPLLVGISVAVGGMILWYYYQHSYSSEIVAVATEKESSVQEETITSNTRQHHHHEQQKTAAPQPATAIQDENGYMLFALSMGRYGNQMEHLLGTMAAVKKTNRTLVLPPFTSYQGYNVEFVPTDSLFRLDKLREYYPKIIPLHEFMASNIWKEPRVLYCFREPCELNGSPIVPFWKHIGIDSFPETHTFGRLDTLFQLNPKEHPVVALSGAPAPFPMLAQHRFIARYFEWTEQRMPSLPHDAVLVAAHIRAGSDWVKACQGGGIGRHDYFASPQCHEEHDSSFVVTRDICMPSTALIVETLREVGKRVRKPDKRLLLFVGTDVPAKKEELLQQLKDTFDGLWVPENNNSNDPFVDLAVMSKADFFVGNCVSSFTSFAARMRPAGTTKFLGVK